MNSDQAEFPPCFCPFSPSQSSGSGGLSTAPPAPTQWVPVLCCVCVHFSHVQLCATLWTVAPQAPLSKGFFRQEYWSELLCSPPGDLPDPGITPASLMSPALAGEFFTTSAIWESESHSVRSDCDSMNYTVHGILQARILDWVPFPFSRGSFQPRN